MVYLSLYTKSYSDKSEEIFFDYDASGLTVETYEPITENRSHRSVIRDIIKNFEEGESPLKDVGIYISNRKKIHSFCYTQEDLRSIFEGVIIKCQDRSCRDSPFKWLNNVGFSEKSDWVHFIKPSDTHLIKSKKIKYKLAEKYPSVIDPMFVAKYGTVEDVHEAGLFNPKWSEEHEGIVDLRRKYDPRFILKNVEENLKDN